MSIQMPKVWSPKAMIKLTLWSSQRFLNSLPLIQWTQSKQLMSSPTLSLCQPSSTKTLPNSSRRRKTFTNSKLRILALRETAHRIKQSSQTAATIIAVVQGSLETPLWQSKWRSTTTMAKKRWQLWSVMQLKKSDWNLRECRNKKSFCSSNKRKATSRRSATRCEHPFSQWSSLHGRCCFCSVNLTLLERLGKLSRTARSS